MKDSPKRQRMFRELREEEADEARYDGCRHYFTCLRADLDNWRCDPRCVFYVPPAGRTPPSDAQRQKALEGIADLMEELFPELALEDRAGKRRRGRNGHGA
ncbi:MAG: hypothetical protein HQL53_06235 [Magnetococcales bacterium]|nr:hypothetical protein [Magnetococcales bacterium]